MTNFENQGFNTKCVHAGTFIDESIKGVNTPIFTSSSFLMDYDSEIKPLYPRALNTPNHKAVAQKIAALEKAKYAYVVSSGMAAISNVLLACLKPGDHVLFQRQIYGGTHCFINHILNDLQVEVDWIYEFNNQAIGKLLKPNTKLIYIETPSNPLLKIVDLSFVASFAKTNNLISVIDNTFATPINQTPLCFGIDVVVHSGSKYFGGHSDMICGAIATNCEKLSHAIFRYINSLGPVLDANSCYLLERSLKTLALRMERINSNAAKIADFLESNSKVTKVNYPGLKSFEGHALAARQMKNFGGMMSFEVKGKAEDVVTKLKLVASALSLGGVESICSIPRATSHSTISAEERKESGISDSLIRFSTGIEDIEDLIADLEQALT